MLDKYILNKEFDSYIKKTIRNTINNFKKYEQRKYKNEISLDAVKSDDELSVSFYTECADKLEDYFEDEKIINVVGNLKPIQKQIIGMIVLENMTSKEVAQIINKSDSRVRHIYNDTIKQLKMKLKE